MGCHLTLFTDVINEIRLKSDKKSLSISSMDNEANWSIGFVWLSLTCAKKQIRSLSIVPSNHEEIHYFKC